jgi:hypothetical protein
MVLPKQKATAGNEKATAQVAFVSHALFAV